MNYPLEWETGEIQARLRERAGYACEICGLRFDPARLCLDAAARQALSATVFLTREQAAVYLGVPVAVFERRRREAGIHHAKGQQNTDGQWERLYRQVDVEKLRR